MDLVVDCVHEIGPLDHFWRSTGFSPAGLLSTQDMQQRMAHAGSIPPGCMTSARVNTSLAAAMTAPKAAEPAQALAAPYRGRDPPAG